MNHLINIKATILILVNDGNEVLKSVFLLLDEFVELLLDANQFTRLGGVSFASSTRQGFRLWSIHVEKLLTEVEESTNLVQIKELLNLLIFKAIVLPSVCRREKDIIHLIESATWVVTALSLECIDRL